MNSSFQKIKTVTLDITTPLADILNWRWEEERQVMLSEFASGKAERTLAVLRENFSDEWDKKSIKKAPKALIEQLGELSKISKEQKLFSRPATKNEPAVLAIWWPWGHGSTLSLRLTILKNTYEYSANDQNNNSILIKCKNWFIKKKVSL